MAVMDSTLIVLLFILALGLILPEFFRRTKLPFITLIILAGAIFGPYGLNYVQNNETIAFFGFLGMAFLMLMAGLETDIHKIVKSKSKIFIMTFLNGFVPFLFGVLITKAFGYSWLTSALVGVVFISSSVAVIVPTLANNKSIKRSTEQLILSAVMFADIISLIALGFILQNVDQITHLPLGIYLLVLIASLAILFKILPKISNYVFTKRFSNDVEGEKRTSFIIIILIAVLAYFSILGVHPILAAFLVGLFLSGIIKSDKTHTLYSKLHTFGYGLFVPVFFFIVGMEIDISILRNFDIQNILMLSLIFGLIVSKFASGFFAGKLVKLSNKDSTVFGSISMTQLTTTLAVTYAASSLGLLDSALTTSIIILSIITTFLGPFLANYFSRKKL